MTAAKRGMVSITLGVSIIENSPVLWMCLHGLTKSDGIPGPNHLDMTPDDP